MIRKEELEFCENYAISIEKFLSDCFILTKFETKKNNRNRKWKVKHSEISDLVNVIQVPIPFAYRYKELVGIGKLIVVRDDFGLYKVYINPKIISESYKLRITERRLEELKLRDELSKNDRILLEFLENEINDLREDIRLIRHFKGEEDLIKTHEMIDTYEGEVLGMSRKRVEIK